jgi:hypothetical protein
MSPTYVTVVYLPDPSRAIDAALSLEWIYRYAGLSRDDILCGTLSNPHSANPSYLSLCMIIA